MGLRRRKVAVEASEMESDAADKVVKAAGSVEAVAELTGCTETWVRRWTYPARRGGTAGRIPSKPARILVAKIAEGVLTGVTAAEVMGLPATEPG